MKINEIKNVCNQIHNGTFFKIDWETDCSKNMTAAARKTGIVVTKKVHAVCRKGIKYLNIEKVRNEKLKNGEYQIDPQTGELTLLATKRSWAEDVIPNLIIKHKTSGKHYMIIYNTETRPKVQYYIDHKPVTVARLKELELMVPSYWNKDEEPVTMTIPIESIKSIG